MLILFNKPFDVLCQFTDRSAQPRRTLADFDLPPKVYPAGGALAHRVTDPRHKQPKTYLVQVEGTPDESALQHLRRGVALNDGLTRPAEARVLPHAPEGLWPRDPPVRFRKTVPDAWLQLTIREGRNRQVRRMTAAVGLPTLRLLRTRNGEHALGDLAPGGHRVIERRATSGRTPG